MPPKKAPSSAAATGQKRTLSESGDDVGSTKRGSRSKNMTKPDPVASMRGAASAKKQGKKTSEIKPLTEILVPMEDQDDSQHERVMFIDDATHKPVIALYRTTEDAAPMAHLWADFISITQSARDHIGIEALGTFLSQAERDAINLKNNYHLFPSLITSKGALRSKDNVEAANQATRQGGKFIKDATAKVGTKRDLLNRARALRMKAEAINKQAKKYEDICETLDDEDDTEMPQETSEQANGMSYIGDIVPLTRKDMDKYILAHEHHLTATAERLRGDMAGLAAFIHRAEKRLRELIQLKVAADLKLCRDIKKFGEFEIRSWQMESLPSGAHKCQCVECSTTSTRRSRTAFQYPTTLPQVDQDDALPDLDMDDDQLEIKLEEDLQDSDNDLQDSNNDKGRLIDEIFDGPYRNSAPQLQSKSTPATSSPLSRPPLTENDSTTSTANGHAPTPTDDNDAVDDGEKMITYFDYEKQAVVSAPESEVRKQTTPAKLPAKLPEELSRAEMSTELSNWHKEAEQLSEEEI